MIRAVLAAVVSGFASAEPPNVILIVIDDPGYADFDTENRPADVVTPNLDALVAQSTRYANGYVTAPICNASRLALLTGRYQQRFATEWYGGPGLNGSVAPTLADVFHQAGYRTGMVGKVHHGGQDTAASRNHPLNHGYDSFFGFLNSTKHYLKHSKAFAKPCLAPLAVGPMFRDGKEMDVGGFSTGLFGDEARKFVTANAAAPFFLHLSFNALHNYTPQLPPEYLAAKGIPAFGDFDPEKESLSAWRKRLSYPANKHGRAYYLGQLHFLDLEIGKLMATLKETGVDDRTAVFLIGDNGGSLVTYADNGGLRGGKYMLFEGGTRVPFWVRWPGGGRAGVNEKSFVSSLDLLPTFARLCGTEAPEGLDGVPLEEAVAERKLFWDTGFEQAVRHGKWKWLKTNKPPNPKLQITPTPQGEFLYDLEQDPGEATNLIGENQGIAARLAEDHRLWRKAVKQGGP